MLAKILFAACALFVVAHATDIYVATWAGCNSAVSAGCVADCSGTAASSWKYTLDQCTKGMNGLYEKYSLSGSTYTQIRSQTDSTCSTSDVTITAAANTCVALRGASAHIKIATGTTYLSASYGPWDCTSGTCRTQTSAPTNTACKRSPVPLSMRIDSSFPSRSRLHRNHVRLPWSRGSLDRIRLDS